jgi:hypothetical protein
MTFAGLELRTRQPMRIAAICFLLFVTWLPAFGAKDDPAEVAAKAASEPLDHQPDLYVKAAQEQLKVVDSLYDQNKVEDGRTAVQLLTEYCDKAADTAVRSGKKLKKAEIEIRKIAERLNDIQHSLSFDDQAPVKTAAQHLQDLRTELLDRMFSDKEKKKK